MYIILCSLRKMSAGRRNPRSLECFNHFNGEREQQTDVQVGKEMCLIWVPSYISNLSFTSSSCCANLVAQAKNCDDSVEAEYPSAKHEINIASSFRYWWQCRSLLKFSDSMRCRRSPLRVLALHRMAVNYDLNS